MSMKACIEVGYIGYAKDSKNSDDTNSELQESINQERIMPGRYESRQKQAPQTHASHKGSQQNSQRNAGSPYYELQQLQPDDFVYESGTTAPKKQKQKPWKITALSKLI